MRNWRLYAKFKGQKQFKPVDWTTGKRVTNLIYASMFTQEEKETIEKVDIPLNPDIKFEFRYIKNGL